MKFTGFLYRSLHSPRYVTRRQMFVDILLCVSLVLHYTAATKLQIQHMYDSESNEENSNIAVVNLEMDLFSAGSRKLTKRRPNQSKKRKSPRKKTKKSKRSNKLHGKSAKSSKRGEEIISSQITLANEIDVFLEAQPIEGLPGEIQVEIEETGALIAGKGAVTMSFDTIPESIQVQFPEDINITAGTALRITEFILYQLSTLGMKANSPGRKLDSPGCDNFPDLPCTLGCCAVHDRCYDENSCNALSWATTACNAAIRKAESLANKANPITWLNKALEFVGSPVTVPTINLGGKIGEIACTAVTGISNKCSKCNDAVVTCIVDGCTGVDPITSEQCYDNKCGDFFECPGRCPIFSLDDEKCCGCKTPGTDCSSPATCGNGICEAGENKNNCKVDCAYICTGTESSLCWGLPFLIHNPLFDDQRKCIEINSDKDNCGSCGNKCNFECQFGECHDPVGELSWTEADSGFNNWQVFDDERTIRYRFRDSTSCGGSGTDGPEGGLISTTFDIDEEVNVKFIVSGKVESQVGSQDTLVIKVDGTPVVLAKSSFSFAWSKFRTLLFRPPPSFVRCEMSDPLFFPINPFYGGSGVRLSPGGHTISMTVSSKGMLHHKDAIYEIEVVFFKA